MRVLIVSSRFPWPPYTGDRLRACVWLQALAGRASVTLVAPPGVVPAGVGGFTHVRAPASVTALVAAAATSVGRGLPATALLAAGRDWRSALAAADAVGGPFDVAVVLLARTHPWVFRHLRARRVVLDAIDALGANLEERARAAGSVASRLWSVEARRTMRLEREAAPRYERVLVVAEDERAAFGGNAEAVPHGVDVLPITDGQRDIDVAFWGRFAYFANLDATRLLLEEIWPRVRAARSGATLQLGGAQAPGWIRDLDGSEGITVLSPLGDRAAWLRRVKVAVLSMRYGTGQSNKAMEAGEGGCAIVSTSAGVRALPDLAAVSALADDPERIAAEIVALLSDDARRRRAGGQARRIVETVYDRTAACARLAALALGED
ncbi:MAG: glycosyltransferase [Acidobacteriota bacterium]